MMAQSRLLPVGWVWLDWDRSEEEAMPLTTLLKGSREAPADRCSLAGLPNKQPLFLFLASSWKPQTSPGQPGVGMAWVLLTLHFGVPELLV